MYPGGILLITICYYVLFKLIRTIGDGMAALKVSIVVYSLSTGCELRIAGCGIRVAGYGLRDTGCGIRVAGCELRDSGYG
jgi:hypothetical protein